MVWTTLTPVDGVSRQLDDGVITVRPRGDLDLGGAPAFRSMLGEAISGARIGQVTIDVDLAAVDFVDSAGIGVLIGGLRRARARGGTLRLNNVPSELQDVFDLTGLGSVFETVDS